MKINKNNIKDILLVVMAIALVILGVLAYMGAIVIDWDKVSRISMSGYYVSSILEKVRKERA